MIKIMARNLAIIGPLWSGGLLIFKVRHVVAEPHLLLVFYHFHHLTISFELYYINECFSNKEKKAHIVKNYTKR